MRVDLKGVRHVGVSDPIAHDFRIHPGVQGQRGVGMPNVVQPDAGYAGSVDQAVEPARDGVRMNRPAVIKRALKEGV